MGGALLKRLNPPLALRRPLDRLPFSVKVQWQRRPNARAPKISNEPPSAPPLGIRHPSDLRSSMAKFRQKTDQPNGKRQDTDGDAQYGCCRVRTCDNPDDAGADNAERNEIRQYGVDHGVTPVTLFLSAALGAPRLRIPAPGDIANMAIHVAIGNSRWRKINFVPGRIGRRLVDGSCQASHASRARAGRSRQRQSKWARSTRLVHQNGAGNSAVLIFPRPRADFLLPLHPWRGRPRAPAEGAAFHWYLVEIDVFRPCVDPWEYDPASISAADSVSARRIVFQDYKAGDNRLSLAHRIHDRRISN